MSHSADRRFEKAVAKAFDDPELEVRRQAITAAGVFSMVRSSAGSSAASRMRSCAKRALLLCARGAVGGNSGAHAGVVQ